MPIAAFMGTPLGVPYGDLRIADESALRLDWLAVSTYASAANINVRTDDHAGRNKLTIVQAANTSVFYPFPRPLDLERGLYIQSDKPALISFGARPG